MQKWSLRSAIFVLAKIGAVLLLLNIVLFVLSQWLLDSGDLARRNSELGLLWDASRRGCAKIEHFQDAADERGFRTEQIENRSKDDQFKKDFPSVLLVWIDPPVPFGDEVESYYFDVEGCLGDWLETKVDRP
jgi:hypothetical protein